MPLTCLRVAFDQRAGWPVAVLGVCEQRLVDVELAAAGDDIAGALGHHGPCQVVVALVQKPAAWVDVAPEVAAGSGADLTLAGRQRFRVEQLGNVVAPGEGVEGAQQVGHEGAAGSCAAVAEAGGELAERIAAGMADHVGILELGQVVFVVVVGRAVAAGRRRGVGRAHQSHLQPGIGTSIRVAGHHRIRHEVAHLDRGLH
ncbi:hypothetical protein D9M70_545030 [compost metagenome]